MASRGTDALPPRGGGEVSVGGGGHGMSDSLTESGAPG
jgi:hypothetical protein